MRSPCGIGPARGLPSVRRVLAPAVLLLLAACSGGSASGDTGVASDLGPDRGRQDSGMDGTIRIDVPPVACTSAAACDDEVACTVDECDPTGHCVHRPDDVRCTDGRFCNGTERCDLAGCLPGTAPACNDGNDCTTDRCDEGDNACRNDPRDLDRDGDPDSACGGGDCDDHDSSRSSLAREVCNGRDDNCNMMTDEGVLSPCGNCDAACRQITTGGTMGRPWDDAGRHGVEYDPMAGGLLLRAESRMADYLWVPNTNESTLSKWDAVAGREVGRYRVGLPSGECRGACCWAEGCNQPSRVVVDGYGDAYVANRGFSMQGTVTKIAADVRDCVDRNGNGRIDTSTGATPLAWNTDECVLWNVPVGPVNAILRAIATDRGDAMFPQGYVWVGGYNSMAFWKLNPVTGAVIAGPVSVSPAHPYGAVVTADGNLWVGVLSDAVLRNINTVTGTAGASAPFPRGWRLGSNANSYGITADARGRIWLAGWDARDVLGYDPRSGQWTRANTTGHVTGYAGRGITTDSLGNIWLAWSASGESSSRLLSFPADEFVPGGTMPTTSIRTVTIPAGHDGPSGLGFDRLGNAWLAHHITSQLVRYTPSTGAIMSFTGPNRVYTYSDFTGSVRRTVIGTGTYVDEYDAGCDQPDWAELSWSADTPGMTRLIFNVSTALTMTGLGGATSVAAAVAPTDRSPVDVAAALRRAMVQPRRFMRVTITFQPTLDPVQSPVLRTYQLTWHCPYHFPGT